MPDSLRYIYGWFAEVFAGEIPGWEELGAYSEIKGIDIQFWEAKLIRKLAAEYNRR